MTQLTLLVLPGAVLPRTLYHVGHILLILRIAVLRGIIAQYVTSTPYVVKGAWKHRTWTDQQGKLRHENTFFITDIQAL